FYQDPNRADRSAFRPMGLPEVGLIQRSEDCVWAYGLAVAAPAGFGTHYQLGNDIYSSFASLAKIMPGAACQVTENLSMGASLGLGVSYAVLDGPYVLQTGPLAGARALVDIEGAGATTVWSVGLQYRLSDSTTLGVAYQSESRF